MYILLHVLLSSVIVAVDNALLTNQVLKANLFRHKTQAQSWGCPINFVRPTQTLSHTPS